MNGSRWIACAFAAASVCGCFNSSSYTPEIVTVRNQNILLYDSSVPTGTSRAWVWGHFFSTDTAVYWNGRKQVTTYQGAPGWSLQLLQVDLDPDATRVAGTAQVTATNEGSFLSAPLAVPIFDAALALTAISPQQAPVGAPSTTITLTGTGFRPSSLVYWNGAALQMTFVSSTSLTATVPAALLNVAGDGFVQVSQQDCNPQLQHCDPRSNVIAFSVGPATRSIVQHATADLAWDATHSLLFASSSQPSGAGSVTAFDPVSGNFGVSVATTDTASLSISDQDQFLYVSSQTGRPVRYGLPGLTAAVTFPAGTERALAMAAPGAPATAALLSSSAWISIVDGTVARQNTATIGVRAVVWGFDSSRLFGLDSFQSRLLDFTVDQTGAANGSAIGSAVFANNSGLYFDRTARRLYGDAGENFDEQGGDSRPFSLPTYQFWRATCRPAIDGAGGKAFFACREDAGLTVRSFDLATQQPISRLLLLPADAIPVRVVRWATDGLAVAAGPSIYLYRGPFVH